MTSTANIVYLYLFFGSALVVGIYFTWILLRNEMRGRPKPPPDTYDFGFGSSSADPKTHSQTHY